MSDTAALRRAFDDAFAAPPRAASDESAVPVLLLTVGGDPFAVRVAEVSGFERARRRLALPVAPPHLLGLCGLRGRLLPVFSLATLLGYPREAAESWMVLVGTTEPLALAFAQFEGLTRLGAEADGRAAATARHVRGCVRLGDARRGVLDLSSLRNEIRTNAGLIAPAKEQ